MCCAYFAFFQTFFLNLKFVFLTGNAFMCVRVFFVVVHWICFYVLLYSQFLLYSAIFLRSTVFVATSALFCSTIFLFVNLRKFLNKIRKYFVVFLCKSRILCDLRCAQCFIYICRCVNKIAIAARKKYNTKTKKAKKIQFFFLHKKLYQWPAIH